ncbi:MAG: hypothetical protein ACXADH_13400 [Candidatus Kariarchaeaceae archaeon]|jgi:hypothetical protein
MEEVQKVKKKYQDQLFKHKGVVGIGIGKKTVKGKETDDLAIIVSVELKVDEAELPEEDLLPEVLEGVPIDVQQVGILKIQKKEE